MSDEIDKIDNERVKLDDTIDEVDSYTIKPIKVLNGGVFPENSSETALTQSQEVNDNLNEFSYEATETSIENDLAAENALLKAELEKTKEQYGNLQGHLRQNEEIIELQKKEL